MNKKTKKVLILSLGNGGGSNEVKCDISNPDSEENEKKLKKIIEEKANVYHKTNYKYGNDVLYIDQVFIADSLIKRFEAEIVFVVGTPGSAWTSFFVNHKIIANKEEKSCFDEQKNIIKDIWHAEGKWANESDLDEKDVAKVKNAIALLKDDLNVEKISAIVLPNGKNDKELSEIYSLINEEIKSELNEKDVSYDVAFDITHSFRSIPFYNYAVLNYLKQVTDIDVNISKIYYGCFELKYKNTSNLDSNNNSFITPVFELDRITRIMNLTNAVSSFNECGSIKSIVSLLENLENKDEKMIEILNELEWTIESNNGDAVYGCFVKMIAYISENKNNCNNEYTDILNALEIALSIPVYGSKSLFDIKDTQDPIEYANNQLMLAKWYKSKHRYSQALCVACEAYRSYLACIYGDGTVEYIKKEGNRKNAKDNFKRAIQYAIDMNNNLSSLKICNSLIDTYRKAYDLRNSSAHNLKKNIISVNLDDKNNINLFFEDLENFANIINSEIDLNNIRNVCCSKTTLQTSESYLFVFKRKSENKIKDLKDKINVEPNILPKELQFYFSDGRNIEDEKIFEIGKYIESVFDLKTLNILINEDVNKDAVIKLCQLFDCLGIKADKVKIVDNNLRFTKRDFPKLLFDPVSTPYDEYDNRYFNLKIETILTNPLDNQERIIDDIYNSNNDIGSKIDIIMNNTLNLIFEKVDTDCPQSDYLKVLNDLATKYGFINTVINGNSSIIVEYKKAFETDTNNNLINEIKIDNYSIKGKNGLNNLKQFSRLLVYYSFIIKDKNNKKRNEKYTQSYIDEYVKLLER